MRLRTAAIAVFLGLLMTAATGLSLQPLLGAIHQALVQGSPGGLEQGLRRVEAVLPLVLALGALLTAGVAYAVLLRSFGRPLQQAEQVIERVIGIDEGLAPASLEGVSPRLRAVLRRVAESLQFERERNRSQVAELRDANQALQHLQSQLVAADRLATVGKLAAGVAHEVGNPLSGILGYLSLIRSRGSASPEVVELVALVEREVARIDQVVRALLEMGRPSRGRAAPLDVRPVIDSCIKLLSSGDEFRALNIRVEGPASLYLRAEGGPLSQVLVNLLLNAAQAMGGGPPIVVRARVEGAVGHIEVLDCGPGLGPGIRERLFEPFFTTKPAGKGTGLGLAVSRHLLSQFGGALEAGNRPEGGAVFSIRLPVP